MKTYRQSLPQGQQGAVLFVALVFLILITLLALTATGTSILQEKMTGGMRNGQLAAMGADSGLRGTESWLWNLNFTAAAGQPLPPCIGATAGGSTCVYRPKDNGTLDATAQQFRTSGAWVGQPGGSPAYGHTLTGLTGNLATASLAQQPVVLIEDMGPNVPPGAGQQSGAIDPEIQRAYLFYRITARSQGGNAAAQRVVESVFTSSNLTDTGINP